MITIAMKKILCILALCLPLTGGAQGIVFHDLPLNEALAKAARENKWVFVDCYTSWCGPCKKLAAEVFPQEAVGTYVNARFVAVKYDVEKEAYRHVAKDYAVRAYPTLLVLNAKGELVDKLLGYKKGPDLIQALETCYDKTKTLAGLKEKFSQGQMQDQAERLQLLDKLLLSGDPQALEMAESMYAQLSPQERCSAPYWYFYANEKLTPLHAPRVTYVVDHYSDFCAQVGKEKVDLFLAKNYQDIFFKALSTQDSTLTHKDLSALRKQYRKQKASQLDQLEILYGFATDALGKNPSAALIKRAQAHISYLIQVDGPEHNHKVWAMITDRLTQDSTPAQKQLWVKVCQELKPHVSGYMVTVVDYMVGQFQKE